ncbi:hypothetical protein [Crocosphaera sp.]|uniref:hypothetical protein n=1 Tax=Crocosphaera sp. TaxID=2729996 RepID=UPI002618A6AD|nr:hypothetical protein [Crocosphaera sp.]MDJ0581435.1 hypothetical protein [Crocosphaera sp.]
MYFKATGNRQQATEKCPNSLGDCYILVVSLKISPECPRHIFRQDTHWGKYSVGLLAVKLSRLVEREIASSNTERTPSNS